LGKKYAQKLSQDQVVYVDYSIKIARSFIKNNVINEKIKEHFFPKFSCLSLKCPFETNYSQVALPLNDLN